MLPAPAGEAWQYAVVMPAAPHAASASPHRSAASAAPSLRPHISPQR